MKRDPEGNAVPGVPRLRANAECHRGHSLQFSRNGTEAVPYSFRLDVRKFLFPGFRHSDMQRNPFCVSYWMPACEFGCTTDKMAAILEQRVPVCAAVLDRVRSLSLSNRASASGTQSKTALSVADGQDLVLAVLPVVCEISRLDYCSRDGNRRHSSTRDCSNRSFSAEVGISCQTAHGAFR